MDNIEKNESSTHSQDQANNPLDADIVAEQSNSQTMQDKLLSSNHWLRFVFMALFAFIALFASYVVLVLIFIQFVFALVTGKDNDHNDNSQKLREFGSSLSQYIFQMLNFLTYNSEQKPFPFADWPQSKDKE